MAMENDPTVHMSLIDKYITIWPSHSSQCASVKGRKARKQSLSPVCMRHYVGTVFENKTKIGGFFSVGIHLEG